MKKITIVLMMFVLLAYSCEKTCIYRQKHFIGDYMVTSQRFYPPSWGMSDTTFIYQKKVTELDNSEGLLYGNNEFGYKGCDKGEYKFKMARENITGVLIFKEDKLMFDYKNHTLGDSSHDEGVKIK